MLIKLGLIFKLSKLSIKFSLQPEWYFEVDILNSQQFKFKFDIQNFEF